MLVNKIINGLMKLLLDAKPDNKKNLFIKDIILFILEIIFFIIGLSLYNKDSGDKKLFNMMLFICIVVLMADILCIFIYTTIKMIKTNKKQGEN